MDVWRVAWYVLFGLAAVELLYMVVIWHASKELLALGASLHAVAFVFALVAVISGSNAGIPMLDSDVVMSGFNLAGAYFMFLQTKIASAQGDSSTEKERTIAAG